MRSRLSVNRTRHPFARSAKDDRFPFLRDGRISSSLYSLIDKGSRESENAGPSEIGRRNTGPEFYAHIRKGIDIYWYTGGGMINGCAERCADNIMRRIVLSTGTGPGRTLPRDPLSASLKILVSNVSLSLSSLPAPRIADFPGASSSTQSSPLSMKVFALYAYLPAFVASIQKYENCSTEKLIDLNPSHSDEILNDPVLLLTHWI